MMQNYVLGFVFKPDLKHVWLIRKNKPEWQAELLNGIGGKVEINEPNTRAMVRECWEEAGVELNFSAIGYIEGNDWRVYIYYALTEKHLFSQESELISIYRVSELPTSIIPNLGWLIPMCVYAVEHSNHNTEFRAIVTER